MKFQSIDAFNSYLKIRATKYFDIPYTEREKSLSEPVSIDDLAETGLELWIDTYGSLRLSLDASKLGLNLDDIFANMVKDTNYKKLLPDKDVRFDPYSEHTKTDSRRIEYYRHGTIEHFASISKTCEELSVHFHVPQGERNCEEFPLIMNATRQYLYNLKEYVKQH